MAGKLNKYLSYGIEMDLDLVCVCGKIDVNTDGHP